MNHELLRVEDLRTYFFSREGTVRAVDGVNFAIRRGETLGIAGESGCGKSVTAQSVLRIVPRNGRIVGGRILFEVGGEVTDLVTLDSQAEQIMNIRGSEISMIFQEPMASFSPVHTVGNQIIEVIRLHQGASKRAARELAMQSLREVGMPKPEQIIDAYPFNLSGGMRQRAMIAMALSCKPSLLIADEPTTAVDVTIQALVLDLIERLQAELNMALMIITHDLAVIAELADNVLVMYLGKSVEYGAADELFRSPKHPYTRGLLNSVPTLEFDDARARIEPISGTVPSPHEVPRGCSFHPRCPDFIAGTCDIEEPAPISVAEDHVVLCHLYP